ncbi:MAG: WecB/TagA/CpsF family glycosyltransferase [Deltaproteobacteria bacterium]|nr:WecB/TagA/CpsF family glycosyltransferase [Deltaproteobacteria bacterium]
MKNELNPNKVDMLGCKIDSLTMDETVQLIDETIRERIPRQHVVVNALKFAMMHTDPELKRIVNSCDIVSADGLPVVWASRLLGKALPVRVAGVDLFFRLVDLAAHKGYRPFFFGAREHIVKKVINIFESRYPQLDIAGYRNGYFSPDEEQGIADQIRESRADILFVGMSSPKKEQFLNKWMTHMQVPFSMGVGGSFDIAAGFTQRAPKWMQETGLEWFYRVLQEPRRMWWRYTKTNSIFIWLVFKEYFKSRAKKTWPSNKGLI